MRPSLSLALLLSSCTCGAARESEADDPVEESAAPVSLDAIAELAGDARRGAAGDFDGDDRLELALATVDTIRIVELDGRERGRLSAPGGAQILASADLDRDGTDELLAGWGRSREHPNAPARVVLYRLDGDRLVAEEIATPETERAEITAIVPAREGLVIAHFVSQYMVRVARARRSGASWTLNELATIRLATSVDVGDVDGDGSEDVVVGRVYGDAIDQPGDAFVLREDGTRTPIPIVGGVRTMKIANLDDGPDEVLIGDGWDRNYGQNARPRLTIARWRGIGFVTETIDEAPGNYGLFAIEAADVDADRTREIVAMGNAKVRLLRRDGEGWQGRDIGDVCFDLVIADLDAERGDDILALCDGGARAQAR